MRLTEVRVLLCEVDSSVGDVLVLMVVLICLRDVVLTGVFYGDIPGSLCLRGLLVLGF